MECVQIVERRIRRSRRRNRPPFIGRTWSRSMRVSIFCACFRCGFLRSSLLLFMCRQTRQKQPPGHLLAAAGGWAAVVRKVALRD